VPCVALNTGKGGVDPAALAGNWRPQLDWLEAPGPAPHALPIATATSALPTDGRLAALLAAAPFLLSVPSHLRRGVGSSPGASVKRRSNRCLHSSESTNRRGRNRTQQTAREQQNSEAAPYRGNKKALADPASPAPVTHPIILLRAVT
jgi:hypothetical protein